MKTTAEESPKKNPLVNGKVTEESKLKKALGIFLAEDFDKIGGSLKDDYIRPRLLSFRDDSVRRLKEFVADSLIGCIEMLLFGKSGRKGRYVSSGPSYQIKYENQFKTAAEVKNQYEVKMIVIDSYPNAEEVRRELVTYTKKYKYASVADYYQLCNVPTSKSDFDYGWFDLVSSEVLHTAGGYYISFPKPVALR